MKQVLLIGDSIRSYYAKRVEELLGNEYRIWKPNENCRFAKYTLNSLRHYNEAMRKEDFFPDIIHWNIGLWDLNHLYQTGKAFTEINEYVRDMEDILVQLKRTGAKIIFATTTPTRKERETAPDTQHFNSEIKEYNEAVLKAIGDKVDAVNDLYAVVEKDIDKYICDDKLHPSEEGIEVLAQEVVKYIKEIDVTPDDRPAEEKWKDLLPTEIVDEIQANRFK